MFRQRWMQVVAAVMLMALLLAAAVWAGLANRDPRTGVYLQAGMVLLDVQHEPWGAYRVSSPDWFFQTSLTLQREGNELVLLRKPFLEMGERLSDFKPGDPRLARDSWLVTARLEESTTTQGDWDLVDGQFEPGYPWQKFEPRWPGYLHRFDDRRALEYARMANGARIAEKARQLGWSNAEPPPAAPDPQAFLALARAIEKSQPEDPYAQLFVIDALGRCGDVAGLRSVISLQARRMSATPITRFYLAAARRNLKALELSRAGNNAADALPALLGRQVPRVERLRLWPSLLQYSAYGNVQNLVEMALPNFLEMQVACKVVNVEAMFALLRGDRSTALYLSAGNVRLGQLMLHGNGLITKLIGAAVQSVGNQGLGLHVTSGCSSAADLADARKQLEALEQTQVRLSKRDLMESEMLLAQASKQYWTSDDDAYGINHREAVARCAAAYDKFELVRVAAALRWAQMQLGTFPGEAEGLQSFLPVMPVDSFTQKPLRFGAVAGGARVWSPGPDKHDDGGAVDYDPTNGTTSRGDLTLDVPLDRKYPFPAGGVHAATRAELLKQFPHNLPFDPFADQKLQPLKVSAETPPRIFSWGPDTDQWSNNTTGPTDTWFNGADHSQPFRLTPEAQYDPTNGTTSEGDLIMTVPR